jgi:hypothetical protein
MVGMMSSTWIGLGEVLHRAGWRVGMFTGVVIGGLLASFVVPAGTGARGTAGALSGSQLAQVRILPLARPAVHVITAHTITAHRITITRAAHARHHHRTHR